MHTKDEDGPGLLHRYRKLKGKFKEILTALIQPPPYPCPSTLLHFDLQATNIMFRYGGEPSAEPTAPAPSEDEELDVRIHNWKIASFGACTHDLAFLLLSSLSSRDRQENTIKFIKYYHHVFKVRYNLLANLSLTVQMFEIFQKYSDNESSQIYLNASCIHYNILYVALLN